MGFKWLLGAAGIVVAGSLVACMVTPDDGVSGGADLSNAAGEEFNKNTIIADRDLKSSSRDMSADDIQKFLEKTPYGKKSILATYTEGGKTAAQIMSETAAKYHINPLELVVRAQMEQSLISKTTASDESISIAFGCGCPHSPVCSSKYEGFANQAECAAGTLSRSMDKATTSTGTVSGWKMGTAKATEDKIDVTPSNAATAALYTYTPWVGEAGGGKKGVGGASLHFQVWSRFADAIAKSASGASSTNTPTSSTTDAGTDPGTDPGSDPSTDPGSDPTDDGTDPGGSGSTDPGTDPSTDPGTADAGAGGDAGRTTKTNAPPSDGSDDSDILKNGNAPPTTNAPPPRSSSRSADTSSSSDGNEEEASSADLASKKKSTGGCSSTGGTGGMGDASLIGLAMIGAVIAGKRRRKQA